MQRRCKRSLADEMIQAGETRPELNEAVNSPRTRSRSNCIEFVTPSKRVRSQGDPPTPAKKRSVRDEYDLKTAIADSDTCQSTLRATSFYGGSSKRYLSPLERSQLKPDLVSESDSDIDRGHRMKTSPVKKVSVVNKSNSNRGKQRASRKTNGTKKRNKELSTLVAIPHTNISSSTEVNSSSNKFFKHSSPGKKNFMKATISAKGCFQLSFKAKKVKPGSTPKKMSRSEMVLPGNKSESETKQTSLKNCGVTVHEKRSMTSSQYELAEQDNSSLKYFEPVGDSGQSSGSIEMNDDIVKKDNDTENTDVLDSGCISVASGLTVRSDVTTPSDNWSTNSTDSFSIVLLPDMSPDLPSNLSPLRSSPASELDTLASKQRAIQELNTHTSKSVDKTDGNLSSSLRRLVKRKPSVSSNRNTVPFQAEDFLSTPAKHSGEGKGILQGCEPPAAMSSPRPDTDVDAISFYPLFAKVSPRNASQIASSNPGTPGSCQSYERVSKDSPIHSPSTQTSPTRTPLATITSSLSNTPRRSPRKQTPRHTPGSSRSAKSSKSSPSVWRKLKDKDGMSQMTLDFGQKLQAVEACPQCGMTYTHGDALDEATHSKFHKRLDTTLKFKGWQKQRIVQEFPDGSKILMVYPDEKLAMKKVEAVKQVVDEDLGFVVENSTGQRSQSKAFIFVSAEQRITGFCLAEVITKGYRVISESEVQVDGSPTKRRRPWCCSTKAQPARCGINRIWVLRSERKHGVASKLLDCVRYNFVMGYIVKKNELGFSDPTPDGRQFASKYTANPNFLVYKH